MKGKKGLPVDIGCGSVGRAVACNIRGPRFESRHRQNLYSTFVYCIEKTKINKKRPGIVYFKKNKNRRTTNWAKG